MNQQDLERLETEAAEILGAMKALFQEFQSWLGEIVSAQRIASSEARAEGAQVTKDLHELRTSARAMVSDQRTSLARLEREWQLRIDDNAKRAGKAQAQAFGEDIAQGLHRQLAELAADVKASTRRYTWKSSLQWALGIALAIPITVSVCLLTLSQHAEPVAAQSIKTPEVREPGVVLPKVHGLTPAQTREAVSKLSLCQVPLTNEWHVCIEVERPPLMGLGPLDNPRAAIRGM